MKDIELRLSRLNGTLEADYGAAVERAVRKRYTVSAELAVLRQRDTKPEEFEEYNTYVEQCKARVREEMGIE